MKKNIKIIFVIALTVMLALLLVACGEIPSENVNGNYYNIDKDDGIIEILTVNGGEFTILSFTTKDFGKLPENAEEYEKINELYADEIAQNGSTFKGTCTFTNNAFVESRLDLKYTEGKSGSIYVYLKDGSFNYSPKMGSILIYALLGFCITLAVLCLLMGIIKLLGFSVDKIGAKVKEKAENKKVDQVLESNESETKLAKGSAGDLKLENVSDRDAAMIMAIVADELKEPLNSLRFVSIRDITDEEAKKQ